MGNWPLGSRKIPARSQSMRREAFMRGEAVPVYSSGAYMAPITGLIFHPEAGD